jgi:hypothetical protein
MISLLRSEWTKFRSVRGWMIGIILAPLVTIGFSALTGSASQCGYMYPGPDGQTISGPCSAPKGPGGELVQDQFYLTRQTLTGNGGITVRMTGLSSSDLQPWAKAGIIIKASAGARGDGSPRSGITPGSAYAAMMLTGAHGARFEWDYVNDVAGSPGAAPRWLRLIRTGDTIKGYDSADGAHWTEAGTATLAGLPPSVQIGMFATTPGARQNSSFTEAITATGTFDNVSLTGRTSAKWTGIHVNSGPPLPGGGQPYTGFQQTGASAFTVTGMGNIAPDVPGNNGGTSEPITRTLTGTFAGLIVVIVIGAIYITAEYRRGMIRTTFAATPARGAVLVAKAVVIGAVTFVAALAGAALAIPVASHELRAGGNVIVPLSTLTYLRVAAGTAAVFAGAAILGLTLGALFRRGVAAVTTGIVVIVVPYFLAIASPGIPATLADWLMRVFPTAALAVQQTIPVYPQVASSYLPFNGFFPLTALAGFAVLIAWAGGALWLAARQLQRADA